MNGLRFTADTAMRRALVAASLALAACGDDAVCPVLLLEVRDATAFGLISLQPLLILVQPVKAVDLTKA